MSHVDSKEKCLWLFVWQISAYFGGNRANPGTSIKIDTSASWGLLLATQKMAAINLIIR